jgi:hypothetical protein
MKHITRALVAAAAAEKVTGRQIEHMFDHTEGCNLPVTTHLSPTAQREKDVKLVLLGESAEVISVQIHDDLFSGWDHETGAYFAGALYESDVMLYDDQERRYFKFSIH